MVCLQCGRENEDCRKSCLYCGYSIGRAKEDIGFSRPDTQYIGPKVVDQYEEEAVYQEISNPFPMQGTQRKKQRRQHRSAKIRRLNYKNKMIGLFSVVIIVLAAFIMYWNMQREVEAFHYLNDEVLEIFADHNKNLTTIFNTQGEKLFEVDEVTYVIYTPNGTAAILYNQNGSQMYYVNAKEIRNLPENIQGLTFSNDGNYLIYSTNNGKEGNLYWYDVVNKKELMLDQDKFISTLIMSPDGNSFAYQASRDPNNYNVKDMDCYLVRNGGEPEFFGKNRVIFALSDDANDIYYYELEEVKEDITRAVYVKKNEKMTYLTDSSEYLIFNQDYSEMMFELDNSTYLWDGSEKIKIYDSIPRDLIIPNRIRYKRLAGITFGLNTFEEKAVIFQDNSVVWIDEQLKSRIIGENADHYFAIHSKKENAIMFGARDLKIKKVTLYSELENKETYINRADRIVSSDDLSNVYYIDRKQLYFTDNQNENRMIAENVADIYLNAKGDIAFFRKDVGGKRPSTGVLYYSIRGGEPVPVEDGQKVAWLGQWNYGTVFAKEVEDDRYDIYYNTHGTEFKPILEDISYSDLQNGGTRYYGNR